MEGIVAGFLPVGVIKEMGRLRWYIPRVHLLPITSAALVVAIILSLWLPLSAGYNIALTHHTSVTTNSPTTNTVTGWTNPSSAYGNNGGASTVTSGTSSYGTLYERNDTFGSFSSGSLFGTTWRAQTFTPSTTHALNSVSSYSGIWGGTGGGTVTISLRLTDVDGKPTGSDLSIGNLEGSAYPLDTNWVNTLMSSYTLQAGVLYALVWRAPSATSGNSVSWTTISYNSYASGKYVQSNDSGVSWQTPIDTMDVIFREYNSSPTNAWGNYGFDLTGAVSQVKVRLDTWSVGDPQTPTSQDRYPTADADVSGSWKIAQTRKAGADGISVGTWTGSEVWCAPPVVASCISDKSLWDWSENDSYWMNGITDSGTNYQLFTLESSFSVPLGSTIVSVGVYEKTSDVGIAGDNEVAGAIRVNGVNYRSGPRNPPANGLQAWSNSAVWTTNPNTGSAWTVEDINGSGTAPLQQFGVSSIDSDPDIKVYATFLIVTYTGSRHLAIGDPSSYSDFIVGETNTGGYHYFTAPPFSVPDASVITDLTLYFSYVDISIATGVNEVRVAVKVNGILYGTTATSVDPDIGWASGPYTFTTNPNTGSAWTVADINGVGPNPLQQIGVSGSDFSPYVGIDYLYARVNYSPYSNFEQVRVSVSWDGGTSWSSEQLITTTGSETTYWYDVTSVTSWTPEKLANGQFLVRVNTWRVGSVASLVSLDWLPVRVMYLPSAHHGVYTLAGVLPYVFVAISLLLGIMSIASDNIIVGVIVFAVGMVVAAAGAGIIWTLVGLIS